MLAFLHLVEILREAFWQVLRVKNVLELCALKKNLLAWAASTPPSREVHQKFHPMSRQPPMSNDPPVPFRRFGKLFCATRKIFAPQGLPKNVILRRFLAKFCEKTFWVQTAERINFACFGGGPGYPPVRGVVFFLDSLSNNRPPSQRTFLARTLCPPPDPYPPVEGQRTPVVGHKGGEYQRGKDFVCTAQRCAVRHPPLLPPSRSFRLPLGPTLLHVFVCLLRTCRWSSTVCPHTPLSTLPHPH